MPTTTNIRSERATQRAWILARPEVKSVRAARTTGTLISVSDSNLAAIGQYANVPSRWAARCEDHGQVTFATTRRLARAAGIHPEQWCALCANTIEMFGDQTVEGGE